MLNRDIYYDNEAGVGIHEIMERLGHQDDEITNRVYLYVTKTMKKEASQLSSIIRTHEKPLFFFILMYEVMHYFCFQYTFSRLCLIPSIQSGGYARIPANSSKAVCDQSTL